MTIRNHSIDVAKGALILLVIAGHVMAGTLEDKPLRFIIYSFHMQFFLFISGYLVNIDKLATFTPRQLFTHYFHRMIGLWILAWIVYTAYDVRDEEITFRLLVHYAAHPYYHLWYVPTLFTLICVSYVVRRVASSRKLALGILTGFAVIFFIISLWVKIPSLLGLSSLIWFVMGMCCRSASEDMLTEVKGGGIWLVYIAIVMAEFMLICHTPAFHYWKFINFPFVVAMLLCWLLPNIKRDALPRSGTLEFIGRYSLQVYLWHMIPVLGLRWYFYDKSHIQFYLASLVVMCMFLMAIKLIIIKSNDDHHSIHPRQGREQVNTPEEH